MSYSDCLCCMQSHLGEPNCLAFHAFRLHDATFHVIATHMYSYQCRLNLLPSLVPKYGWHCLIHATTTEQIHWTWSAYDNYFNPVCLHMRFFCLNCWELSCKQFHSGRHSLLHSFCSLLLIQKCNFRRLTGWVYSRVEVHLRPLDLNFFFL